MAVGTENWQKKTLPTKKRERNEKSSELRRRVLTIEDVAEPVVVPVPRTIVPVEVPNIEMAVRVAKYTKRPP